MFWRAMRINMNQRTTFPLLGALLSTIMIVRAADNQLDQLSPLANFIDDKVVAIANQYEFPPYVMNDIYSFCPLGQWGIYCWWDGGYIEGNDQEELRYNGLIGTTLKMKDFTFEWKPKEIQTKFPGTTKKQFLDAVFELHKYRLKRRSGD